MTNRVHLLLSTFLFFFNVLTPHSIKLIDPNNAVPMEIESYFAPVVRIESINTLQGTNASGILIDANWVLTSAQLNTPPSSRDIHVILGEEDSSVDFEFRHPSYDSVSGKYSLMLLHLTTPFIKTRSAQRMRQAPNINQSSVSLDLLDPKKTLPVWIAGHNPDLITAGNSILWAPDKLHYEPISKPVDLTQSLPSGELNLATLQLAIKLQNELPKIKYPSIPEKSDKGGGVFLNPSNAKNSGTIQSTSDFYAQMRLAAIINHVFEGQNHTPVSSVYLDLVKNWIDNTLIAYALGEEKALVQTSKRPSTIALRSSTISSRSSVARPLPAPRASRIVPSNPHNTSSSPTLPANLGETTSSSTSTSTESPTSEPSPTGPTTLLKPLTRERPLGVSGRTRPTKRTTTTTSPSASATPTEQKPPEKISMVAPETLPIGAVVGSNWILHYGKTETTEVQIGNYTKKTDLKNSKPILGNDAEILFLAEPIVEEDIAYMIRARIKPESIPKDKIVTNNQEFKFYNGKLIGIRDFLFDQNTMNEIDNAIIAWALEEKKTVTPLSSSLRSSLRNPSNNPRASIRTPRASRILPAPPTRNNTETSPLSKSLMLPTLSDTTSSGNPSPTLPANLGETTSSSTSTSTGPSTPEPSPTEPATVLKPLTKDRPLGVSGRTRPTRRTTTTTSPSASATPTEQKPPEKISMVAPETLPIGAVLGSNWILHYGKTETTEVQIGNYTKKTDLKSSKPILGNDAEILALTEPIVEEDIAYMIRARIKPESIPKDKIVTNNQGFKFYNGKLVGIGDFLFDQNTMNEIDNAIIVSALSNEDSNAPPASRTSSTSKPQTPEDEAPAAGSTTASTSQPAGSPEITLPSSTTKTLEDVRKVKPMQKGKKRPTRKKKDK